jgi:hypothetical protein
MDIFGKDKEEQPLSLIYAFIFFLHPCKNPSTCFEPLPREVGIIRLGQDDVVCACAKLKCLIILVVVSNRDTREFAKFHMVNN